MEHANRHASETANESADSPTLKLGLESGAYSRPAFTESCATERLSPF